MASGATIVWFRRDLRLADNPALSAAVARGGLVVPLFIWSPEEEGPWAPGAAGRWWLHRSLTGLDAALRRVGSGLVIRRGGSLDVLRDVLREAGANAVFWNRRYEPAGIAVDTRVKQALRDEGATVESFNVGLLFEPWDVRTKAGGPFQVFTAFWKACLAAGVADETPEAPRRLPQPPRRPAGLPIQALELEPRPDWAEGLRAAWTPGEVAARAELERFLDEGLATYPTRRDRPGEAGTSRISPYLHFGEIGPRQVWRAVQDAAVDDPGLKSAADAFLRELGWREFAHHLLYHFPHTVEQPLREEFKAFPWKRSQKLLEAWRRGRTGYPLVDAGLRELWATGWMHNRVRMVVASFLVKDLLVPWQEGAKWFWDTLVDADLANNTLGWQWTAGCGADAAPFFRIFNPVSQGEKFDPQGDYVRRWVPELARLPDEWLHRPWEAPAGVLSEADVSLGKGYPRPVVDHAEARQRALKAFAAIKRR